MLVTLTPLLFDSNCLYSFPISFHNQAYAAHVYALLNDEPHAMNALEASYGAQFLGPLELGRFTK